MHRIPVLLGTVRRGRKSERVARWVRGFLEGSGRVDSEILDLAEITLAFLEERHRFQEEPRQENVERLHDELDRADALVIVTPEYNHGYPGVLKNALDHYLPEFRRKPVGVVTVSAGGFGGLQCLTQLRSVLIAMGAIPVAAQLPVTRVEESFEETGEPRDESYARRAERFLEELLWLTDAVVDRKAKDAAGAQEAGG